MDWWIAFECIGEKYLCSCILENGHIFDAGLYDDPSVGVHLNDEHAHSALYEHYGPLDFKGVVPWYSLNLDLQEKIKNMSWLETSKSVERMKSYLHRQSEGSAERG
jgi:hypothetical protein